MTNPRTPDSGAPGRSDIMVEGEQQPESEFNPKALLFNFRPAMLDDFRYDMSQEKYWYLSTRQLMSAESVNKLIPRAYWERETVTARDGTVRERLVKPSVTIGRDSLLAVSNSTWWPGKPVIIEDHAVIAGQAVYAQGQKLFNTYIAPSDAIDGRASEAALWVEHVKRLWPNEEEHNFFFNYFAHMLQRPEEKCNAAIVLSGTQGIGKDAALAPLKMAVGTPNCRDINPDALFSRFQPFLESLLIVVNEVRPSKDFHSSSMYDLLKPLCAAPPEDLPLENKNEHLRYVKNRCRLILTTNSYLALHVDREDRRIVILDSPLKQGWHIDAGLSDYFVTFFNWIKEKGHEHIAAFLRARDLSRFNAQAAPPKTSAWGAVVASNTAPDDCVAYALDHLGKPPVVLSCELAGASEGMMDMRDDDRALLRSSKRLSYRMHTEGYFAVSPTVGDRWFWQRTDGGQDRSRLAFVKIDFMNRELGGNQDRAIAEIRAHGKKLFAARALRLIPGGKTNTF